MCLIAKDECTENGTQGITWRKICFLFQSPLNIQSKYTRIERCLSSFFQTLRHLYVQNSSSKSTRWNSLQRINEYVTYASALEIQRQHGTCKGGGQDVWTCLTMLFTL